MNEKTIETFEDYVKAPGVNWSTLKHFFKSPAHVKEYMDSAGIDSDAMRLGRLQHMALLEPEKLKDTCIAAPEFGSLRKNDNDGTTSEQGKANKLAKLAFEEENKNKTIISAKEHKALVGMSAAAYSNPDCRNLLKSITETEKAIFWKDKYTGVDCKGLLDFVTSSGVLVDIKTTNDCRSGPFSKKAAQFHYYGQMSYYLRGAQAVGLELKAAAWIVIESTAPYACRSYLLSDLDKMNCDEVTDTFLRKFKYCSEKNTWPAYQEELQSLAAPEWYISELKNAL